VYAQVAPCFFEGRYPLRTNILNVITDAVLANSQVSPDEVTTPKLLKSKRGYDSAMFGKFHLAGPDKNPFGNGGPHALGWDYFYGFIEGAPHPIDTTAGGVGAIDQTTGEGPYGCGFVNDAPRGLLLR
jgi:arylsulfatase A-like enzyme